MVGRARVAARTDVPISSAGSADTGGRLVRRGRPGYSRGERRVIQRDYVLLILRAECAHTDEVRTVSPKPIVSQQRIRVRPAISPVPMARRAGDRRGEIRNQSRTVLDARQAGDLST